MPVVDPHSLPSLLQADFETGHLYWLPRPLAAFANERCGRTWNTRFAGKEALTAINNYGYRFGSIEARPHLAHRVLWAMAQGAWPTLDLDHINGDRLDNRLINLREVSRLENLHNQRLRPGNESGCHGVTFDTRLNAWVARIKSNYRSEHLGVFPDLADAIAARKQAERNHQFHKNHGRKSE